MNIVKKDGDVYYLHSYRNESELESLVFKNIESIFDEFSILFEKRKIRTSLGTGTIPDGFVVSFKRGSWYIIENELSSHDLYNHIVVQVSKFSSAMKTNRQKVTGNLAKAFDDEIKANPFKKAVVESANLGKERFRAIADILSSEPTLVVIIDNPEPLIDVELPRNSIVIPFQTYSRNQNEISDDYVLSFNSVFDGELTVTGVLPPITVAHSHETRKARPVRLQELVDHSLLTAGQILYFFDGKDRYEEESATIDISSNKLRYSKNGQLYPKSKLAQELLKKHRNWGPETTAQGPLYWVTEDGSLLYNLEEKVRIARGDRR